MAFILLERANGPLFMLLLFCERRDGMVEEAFHPLSVESTVGGGRPRGRLTYRGWTWHLFHGAFSAGF